jgi:putative oxidoreductase
MDIGLLLLRVVVGLLFAGHGAQKLFGWFGGHGLGGTGGFMETLGYRPGKRHAAMAGLAEAGGGLLLALGWFTPLAAATIVGVMVNAIVAVHLRAGVWNTDGGYEYPLVLVAAATALAFTGAGDLSFDSALGWNLSGAGWGFLAVALGCIGGVALLATRTSAPTPATAVTGEGTTEASTATTDPHEAHR